jgi:hypothetical protein
VRDIVRIARNAADPLPMVPAPVLARANTHGATSAYLS